MSNKRRVRLFVSFLFVLVGVWSLVRLVGAQAPQAGKPAPGKDTESVLKGLQKVVSTSDGKPSLFTLYVWATSIEAIAQRARISKRTFYHRFPDKAALFAAVVTRIIQGLRPPPDAPLYEDGSLEEILRRLARLILRAALAPMALALNRLMVAEAQRFPELAAITVREGSRAEVAGQIAAMLDREARAGGLAIDRPEFAAEQFLQMIITLPQRRALGLGKPMTEAELDDWADDCVNLFLNGCRFWGASGQNL